MFCLSARVLLHLCISLNHVLVAIETLWAWLWMAASVVELLFLRPEGTGKLHAVTQFYLFIYFFKFLTIPSLECKLLKQFHCFCPDYKAQEFRQRCPTTSSHHYCW